MSGSDDTSSGCLLEAISYCVGGLSVMVRSEDADLATQRTHCAQTVACRRRSNHSVNISRSTPRVLYVTAARLSREMSLAPCCAVVIAIKAS